ncbi:MAG TPA: ATP-dependent helicase, partial [Eubacteriaceae bacterium]|nr:ATP-dependent helicase [Eubacteriaceae bacterium]
SYYKNNRISGHRDQKKWKSTIKNFEKIFQDYEEAKKKLRVIDFDDMLTNAYETIKNEYEISKTIRNRYGYVNVDESQDTSMLQHEMIRQLVRGHNNLFMVGDEDQSIYAFRAAYPKALLDFPKTYPKSQVLLMEKNYRSTKHIVTHSNRFIRQNKDRYEKEMFTDREKGTRIKSVVVREKNDQYLHVAKQLLQKSDNETCAVLYRNNLSGVAMAHCLKTANIPYYIKEEKSNFFHHWVIKDILYFMEFSMDLKNRSIFRKIYFKMNAYISKEMIAYVEKTDPKQNIFDCLLDNPKLFSYQKQKIREKKRQFEKMTAMPANKMIKYIVETIGYGDFLDAQGKNDKQELDPLRQRLNILQWVTDKAKTITEYKEQLASLQADMKQAKDREWPGIVSLMTVHSSKGLEYDRVYIVDLMEGIFPNSQNSDEMKESEGAMEEEIRLFYVAATRAKDSLELIGAKEMDRKKVETSRFVEAYMKKRK